MDKHARPSAINPIETPMIDFDLQPTLANETVKLEPLQAEDFQRLFHVASDPLIWAGHPNKDRYKETEFRLYFEGGILSKGAFLISDIKTANVIGGTRYYDYNPGQSKIAIGFTFLAREYWGGQYNLAVKSLMLDHAFQFVEIVSFHIAQVNIRSQKAISKLGAQKIREMEFESSGKMLPYYEFWIKKQDWLDRLP